MSGRSLNTEMLPTNRCFGCGAANPQGLHVEFFRDPQNTERLLGKFTVPPYATGLPGVAHGGTLFTVLDCLSVWVKFVLRGDRKLFAVSRSATITYHKPARAGEELQLVGTIAKEPASPVEPMIVHGETYNIAGEKIAEGDFTLSLLPLKVFKKVAGISELPEEYRPFFDEP